MFHKRRRDVIPTPGRLALYEVRMSRAKCTCTHKNLVLMNTRAPIESSTTVLVWDRNPRHYCPVHQAKDYAIYSSKHRRHNVGAQ